MSGIYKSEEGARLVEARYRELLARWPTHYEQRHVSTSQGETFVVACGPAAAPPVVLLQGSGANAAMWMRDVASLAERHRVYCVDVVGEPGLSAPSRPPLVPATYARWLGDVFDGLGLARASLVGVSLGGWISLAFATAHPSRVNGLVLISPSGVGRTKAGFMFKAGALMLMGKWGRRKALMLAVGPIRERPDAAALEIARFSLLIFAHFKPRRERIPVFDEGALRTLTMPVLAVVGAQDALLDSKETQARLKQSAPHATVRLVADAGHVIRGETATIAEFLARGYELLATG
jgi:pimeloyl-ACP methyl ester carboxylesterase